MQTATKAEGWVKPILLGGLAVVALLGVGLGEADAQSTWTNGSADALWATPGNWTSSVPGTGVTTLLPSAIPAGGGTITLPDGAVAGSLTFENSYTLTGGQLALDNPGGPIVVLTGVVGTIGSTLNGTQGLTVSGGGTLVLGSEVNLTNLTIGASVSDPNATSLDLDGVDATFSGTMLVQTNSESVNTITIDPGKKLQIGGPTVYLGDNSTANANTFTNIDFTGGGEFVYDRATAGIFQVGGHQTNNTFGGNSVATVDMSGLAAATIKTSTSNGTVRIGDNQTNGNGSRASTGSTLTLAATSNIVANRLSVGADSASQNSVHTLRLGGVSTEISANSIQVGAGDNGAGTQRGSGVIEFASQTGTLKIRAADGLGAAKLDLINNIEVSNSPMSATVDLRGHDSDLLLGTMTLASRRNGNASTGAGNGTASFSFDTGTLVVDNLVASRRAVGATTNPNRSGEMTSTIDLGGGSVTIGTLDMANNASATSTGGGVTATLNVSGGTVGIGSIAMATTTGAVENIATSTIALTGGVTTLGGNIVRTENGTGIENTTLTLDGGTLDMGGFAIGTATAPVGSGTGSLNLLGGTLKNVAEINGGADISKTGAETLILDGSLAYTGTTIVTEGTALVDGTLSGSESVTVAAGATLGGTGTISGSVTVGGFLTGGDAGTIGTLSIENTLTLDSGASTVFEIGGGLSDRVIGITTLTYGGSFTLEATGIVTAGVYDLFDFSVPWNGTDTFTAIVLPALDGGLAWKDFGGTQFDYATGTVEVVPEPASLALLGTCGAGLLSTRRRRRRQG